MREDLQIKYDKNNKSSQYFNEMLKLTQTLSVYNSKLVNSNGNDEKEPSKVVSELRETVE
jgi:hypothetical protein